MSERKNKREREKKKIKRERERERERERDMRSSTTKVSFFIDMFTAHIIH